MNAAVDLNCLLSDFAERVPQVAHTVVVTVAGLPLAFSDGLPRDQVDQLAGITSGLITLMQGAARVFEGGPVVQAIVEMQRGLLIAMPAGHGLTLAVLAAADCDTGLVLYEMALLLEGAGYVLAQQFRTGPRATASGDSHMDGHDPA